MEIRTRCEKKSDTPCRWTPTSDHETSKEHSSFSSFKNIKLRISTTKKLKKNFPVFKCRSQAVMDIKNRKFQELTIYEPEFPRFVLPPVRKDPVFAKKISKGHKLSLDCNGISLSNKKAANCIAPSVPCNSEMKAKFRVKIVRIDNILQLKKD